MYIKVVRILCFSNDEHYPDGVNILRQKNSNAHGVNCIDVLFSDSGLFFTSLNCEYVCRPNERKKFLSHFLVFKLLFRAKESSLLRYPFLHCESSFARFSAILRYGQRNANNLFSYYLTKFKVSSIDGEILLFFFFFCFGERKCKWWW